MPNLAWIPCPNCNFPNIPENSTCKRCHARLWEPRESLPPPTKPTYTQKTLLPAPPPAYTEETITIYRDTQQKRWLTVSRRWFEYAEQHISFRTPWSNIIMINHWFFEDYLSMDKEPEILRASGSYTLTVSGKAVWRGSIPLRGFGYPEDKALCRDLRRYAPQLIKFMPR